MLSSLLFSMSKSNNMKHFLLKFPFIKKAKEKFVAGETLEEAIYAVKELNSFRMSATLDKLGENINSEKDSIIAKNSYLEILEKIHDKSLNSQISLKLSMMGLKISEEFCAENLHEILRTARHFNNFVQVDMENFSSVNKTIKMFKLLKEDYKNIGICIQANLRRSEKDVLELMQMGSNIRLVKGAYKEAKNVSFQKKKEVDESYLKLARILLSNVSLEHGTYPCFGTHDEKIISQIIEFAEKHKIHREKFEFQMLYGVRKDLQYLLTQKGFNLRIYTSFGYDWYPYFMRRMAEHPGNFWFVLRQLFS